MDRPIKAGLTLFILAGTAFGVSLLFSAHDGTAVRVADWLKSQGCPGVDTRSFGLPMTGSAYAEPGQRRFTDQAREFKAIECEGVNGSIRLYRFSSTAARVRAVAGYPGLRRHYLFCVRGAEVLVDDLLFQPDPTVVYCQRLRFQLYRQSRREPHA